MQDFLSQFWLEIVFAIYTGAAWISFAVLGI
jgi:hypothetical protein